MQLTDLVAPNAILPALKVNSKKQVLHQLAARAAALSGQNERAIFDILMQREKLGSTAVGNGIAIPHGKLAGVDNIIGVFGRHLRGVDFDSLDGGPTHLFFLLVAPEDSASLHLKALARVSRLMKDPAFRERLSGAPDAAEIFRLIKEEDARH